MHDLNSPDVLTSLALVPEQLPAYVRAVSGSVLRFCKGYAVYLAGERAVLVGYPPASVCADGGFTDGGKVFDAAALDETIREVSSWPGLSGLTVLAPFRPASAPINYLSNGPEAALPGDCYSVLDLPYFDRRGEPGAQAGSCAQKLRNMLRRAARELAVCREEPQEAWENGCGALLEEVLNRERLNPGTRQVYARIRDYLEHAPGAALFTARTGGPYPAGGNAAGRVPSAGDLQGFCIGDFSALDTAFYMFAFRRADAVPGCADLLLAALVAEAEKLGHARVNLGLDINAGIGFFKRKWGARPFLPYLETVWDLRPQKRGLLHRLFG